MSCYLCFYLCRIYHYWVHCLTTESTDAYGVTDAGSIYDTGTGYRSEAAGSMGSATYASGSITSAASYGSSTAQ